MVCAVVKVVEDTVLTYLLGPICNLCRVDMDLVTASRLLRIV